MKHNKKMAMGNNSEIERVTEMGIKKEKKKFYEAGTLKKWQGGEINSQKYLHCRPKSFFILKLLNFQVEIDWRDSDIHIYQRHHHLLVRGQAFRLATRAGPNATIYLVICHFPETIACDFNYLKNKSCQLPNSAFLRL